MIPRYSNEKISSIWSDKNRYEIWLKIEIAICEKLCIDKKIPKKDFLLIKNKSKIDIKDIEKLDEKTHHEVIAFLNSVSKKVGKSSSGVSVITVLTSPHPKYTNKDGEISQDEMNKAIAVLEKAKKKEKYKESLRLLNNFNAIL